MENESNIDFIGLARRWGGAAGIILVTLGVFNQDQSAMFSGNIETIVGAALTLIDLGYSTAKKMGWL